MSDFRPFITVKMEDAHQTFRHDTNVIIIGFRIRNKRARRTTTIRSQGRMTRYFTIQQKIKTDLAENTKVRTVIYK